MSVTREELYIQIWTEPVSKVAARYSVSGSFLARICSYLNVPRPERGHWAKLEAGKKIKQPPLPATRPGDYVSWTPGGGLSRPTLPIRAPEPEAIRSTRRRAERSKQHELLEGIGSSFKKTWKSSRTGHLRPKSGALPDIVVSEGQLERALAFANELFLSLEDRGHRVMLAHGHRSDPLGRSAQLTYYGLPDNWWPSQPTVAFLGTVGVGISIFETTLLADGRHSFENGCFIRTSGAERHKPRWSGHLTQSKHEFPSGLLAVRAFSAHADTGWQQEWTETAPGQLLTKVPSVVRSIESAAPTIVPLIQAAQDRRAVEEREWEASLRKTRYEEALRRRRANCEASAKALAATINAWVEARNNEDFFADIVRRANALPRKEREPIIARVDAARRLLGTTDALERFATWHPPDDSEPEPEG